MANRKSSVVSLHPARDGAAVPDGFKGAISGTPLEAAIEEQRLVIWEVEAVLRMAAHALEDISDKLDEPNYEIALRALAQRVYGVGCNLEAAVLEPHAAEIAREREAEAQGGAA
ncbi:MAG: hypothetical protein U1F31_01930 [Steroidobacteraceae bacterium]